MNDMIDTYANLVIEVGVDLQRGQSLVVNCDAGTYDMARALAKSAYRHKAKHVQIIIPDNEILASKLENQSGKDLSWFPDFEKMLDYQICTEEWAYIQIEPIDDRLKHVPMDPEKNQAYRKARRLFHHAVNDRFMVDKLPWCVIAAPTRRWAEHVLGEGHTEEDLWKALVPILRLDTENPAKTWKEACNEMRAHAKILNGLGITKLHYQSPRTDLVVGLCPNGRFMGADAQLPDGRRFLPNIPTEELFTTPNRMIAEGYVTTTKPVSVLDEMTEEVTFRFHEGKVVSHQAKRGSDALDRYFSVDEGTRRLGECALVDERNPIARSGLVFASTLYDENASCHLALGTGFPNCFVGSKDPYKEGCNKSLMHVDFMVGSPDMTITAICMDGRNVPVMENGKFVR
ncbi:MAG: aminopeptidase [Sphaerochaetaceae bacterium]